VSFPPGFLISQSISEQKDHPKPMASIWEQMVIEERKTKAAALGVRVCDLEEEDELLQSIQENLNINNNVQETNKKGSLKNKEHKIESAANENDESYFDQTNFNLKVSSLSSLKPVIPTISTPTIASTSLINKLPCGPWIHLIRELIDKVLVYVGDPDMLGYLKISSKSVFQPSEAVFRAICQQIYLQQTAKKQLVLSNWLSYENMLVNRPRLRLNGSVFLFNNVLLSL
jgi:hypothetical protein